VTAFYQKKLDNEKGVIVVSVMFETLFLPEIKIIHTPKHIDERGFFSETYNKGDYSRAGINLEFLQDNHVMSKQKGTVRGLHFQIPPFAQAKLVRVARGAIFDVAVDIRGGSPTYGKHVSAIISAKAWNQIYIPIGFAHGLVTLEPDTEVIYKVSGLYSPNHDRGLLWNDPALAINWPISEPQALLSDKDKRQPKLSQLPAYFHYEPRGQ
jgi:dTDP-4-dehydrorhamnose 3,5-epimerase